MPLNLIWETILLSLKYENMPIMIFLINENMVIMNDYLIYHFLKPFKF
jgi:hypothetical protein